MSETKTIEERYEQLIQATVDGEDTDVIALHAASLITDLMAERRIVCEQFADYDEMIRREKERRNPDYQKSLPTVDEVTGILKED